MTRKNYIHVPGRVETYSAGDILEDKRRHTLWIYKAAQADGRLLCIALAAHTGDPVKYPAGREFAFKSQSLRSQLK